MSDHEKDDKTRISVLKVLSESFKESYFFYPLALIFLLSVVATALISKVGSIDATQFSIFAICIIVIFIFAPGIIKKYTKDNITYNLSPEIKKPTNIELLGRNRPDIWEDFIGIYNAFNAPWKLEMMGDTEAYVKIHAQRYKNKKLTKCRYLYFYENDERNWDTFLSRFESFIKFEAMVFLNFNLPTTISSNFLDKLEEKIKGLPKQDSLKKLELFLVKKEVPQLTFFQGVKDTGSASILYFNVGPFMSRGLPNKVLYSVDSSFSDGLGDYFHDEINDASAKRYIGKEIFQLYIEIKRNDFSG